GYTLLQQHFPAGTLAPTTVLLRFQGNDQDAYNHFAQLDAVTAALQNVKGVASVQGPTRPDGKAPTTDPTTLQNEIASLPASLREALRKGTGSTTTGSCQGAQCPPTDPATLAAIAAY